MGHMAAVLLLLAVSGFAQAPAPASGRNFLRPIQRGDVTLFGALENLGQRLEQDRELASRGVHRSVNFHYRNFTYEKDFFHVYKGITLKSFMDGRLDMGLYNHRPTRGTIFGPGARGRSTRYEFRLRWNLNER